VLAHGWGCPFWVGFTFLLLCWCSAEFFVLHGRVSFLWWPKKRYQKKNHQHACPSGSLRCSIEPAGCETRASPSDNTSLFSGSISASRQAWTGFKGQHPGQHRRSAVRRDSVSSVLDNPKEDKGQNQCYSLWLVLHVWPLSTCSELSGLTCISISPATLNKLNATAFNLFWKTQSQYFASNRCKPITYKVLV